MPKTIGAWTYITKSNINDLDNKVGELICIEPSTNNHVIVQVCDIFQFCYADETPVYPFGTTCYGWTNQYRRSQAVMHGIGISLKNAFDTPI